MVNYVQDSGNNLGVIRSRKFISDFAEWLVAKIYGGSIAGSKTEKYWDVKVGMERIQVKAHSKAIDNPNRWSIVKSPDRFNTLVIMVLTKDFKVREFYRIPSRELKSLILNLINENTTVREKLGL